MSNDAGRVDDRWPFDACPLPEKLNYCGLTATGQQAHDCTHQGPRHTNSVAVGQLPPCKKKYCSDMGANVMSRDNEKYLILIGRYSGEVSNHALHAIKADSTLA